MACWNYFTEELCEFLARKMRVFIGGVTSDLETAAAPCPSDGTSEVRVQVPLPQVRPREVLQLPQMNDDVLSDIHNHTAIFAQLNCTVDSLNELYTFPRSDEFKKIERERERQRESARNGTPLSQHCYRRGG
jgi:hypothetical protein